MLLPKPLSYASAEAVLTHLNFGSRCDLPTRCPRLATLNRNLPIKVGNIRLLAHSIIIDGVDFRVGIICHSAGGVEPYPFTTQNAEGGYVHDVDKYGFRIIDHQREFQRALRRADQQESDDEERSKRSEVHENRQLELEHQQRYLKEEETYLEGDKKIYSNSALDQAYIRNKQRKIDVIRTKLQHKMAVFKARELGAEVQWTHYLQYTRQSNHHKYIERVAYNKKIMDAQEYMMTAIFKNHLTISLKSLELIQCRRSAFDSLRAFIGQQNLETVKLDVRKRSMQHYRTPLITNARLLTFARKRLPRAWSGNRRVHVETGSVGGCMRLLEFSPQETGTYYTMECDHCANVWNWILQMENIRTTSYGPNNVQCATIRISEDQELNVTLETDEATREKPAFLQRGVFHMRVDAVGIARQRDE